MGSWQVTEVQRHLKGADYPVSGRELSRLARENGADDDLVEALARIDREVDGPNAVMAALKGELGGPTPGPRQDRSPREVEGPAWQVDEVQGYLGGASYPADGGELARLAREQGAEEELAEALEGIGRVDGPTAVMERLRDRLGGPEGRAGSAGG